MGHDGQANPENWENDAFRTDRGPRARDGLLLRFPDDQDTLQTGRSRQFWRQQ